VTRALPIAAQIPMELMISTAVSVTFEFRKCSDRNFSCFI